MTPFELAELYVGNSAKLTKYNEAINLLRESGFEEVIRRLGEPSAISLDHPRHAEISAFEHAERRGWFQAVAYMFEFPRHVAAEREQGEAVTDFGAASHMQGLGYTKEELGNA